MKRTDKIRLFRAFMGLAFMAGTILSFSSCYKKEKLPNRTPVYIPQELKDYMYFKPGTYWIYKEESSGIEDSVWVTSAYNDFDSSYIGMSQTYPAYDYLDRIFEWFRVNTVSNNDGYEYSYSLHTSNSTVCSYNNGEHCYNILRIKSKAGDYVGYEYIFFYKAQIGDWIYANSSSNAIITYVGFYDFIFLSGNAHNAVFVLQSSKNIVENNNITNIYYAMNKGIIKKELIDSNQVWNLVRYNIIQ